MEAITSFFTGKKNNAAKPANVSVAAPNPNAPAAQMGGRRKNKNKTKKNRKNKNKTKKNRKNKNKSNKNRK